MGSFKRFEFSEEFDIDFPYSAVLYPPPPVPALRFIKEEANLSATIISEYKDAIELNAAIMSHLQDSFKISSAIIKAVSGVAKIRNIIAKERLSTIVLKMKVKPLTVLTDEIMRILYIKSLTDS